MTDVHPIPEGFHTVTPHLIVKGAAQAIDFYKEAFGAEEISRMAGPGGKLMHAELRVGTSRLLLADEFPEWGSHGPNPKDTGAMSIHLFVEDVDAVFRRAIEAGAKPLMSVSDQFWGDRYGKIEDPFGHHWSIATRKENLTPEQILERAPTIGR